MSYFAYKITRELVVLLKNHIWIIPKISILSHKCVGKLIHIIPLIREFYRNSASSIAQYSPSFRCLKKHPICQQNHVPERESERGGHFN